MGSRRAAYCTACPTASGTGQHEPAGQIHGPAGQPRCMYPGHASIPQEQPPRLRRHVQGSRCAVPTQRLPSTSPPLSCLHLSTLTISSPRLLPPSKTNTIEYLPPPGPG
uniref:Uncharacterized protein n=1 Tax=Auxenochlorella protothecoides TaxID=3075 RepID=A0A1D2AH91_AUXPR